MIDNCKDRCARGPCCDVRLFLTGESARFGQPKVKLGVIAGMGGTQSLTRLIRRAKSMKLHLSDQMIGAAMTDAAHIASFDKTVVETASAAEHKADELGD